MNRVGIVGAGPIGLVLALELQRWGVECSLIDMETGPLRHPKASTQGARTMENYRRLGIADDIRSLGLPADYPSDVLYCTALASWPLMRLTMQTEGEKRLAASQGSSTDQVPEPLLRCNQMYLEDLLFKRVQALPGIECRFGQECIEVEDCGTHVSVGLKDISGGGQETLNFAYLVGCDGARSVVRRSLGIRYGGQSLDQPFMGGPTLSSYVRAPRLYERLGVKPAWHCWVINPNIRSLLVAVDGENEFLFNTRLESLDVPPTDELAAPLFKASIGADIPFEFKGHFTWRAGHALVADNFGRSRVLLAGDAVHLFTPTGGFGMNTGIDDVANLGWKLAATMHGWGGAKLIESYETERRPIAIRNTSAAKSLARNVGDVPVDPAIVQGDSAGQKAREELGAFLSSFIHQFGSLGVQLGARYDGSPIIAADGTEPPPDQPETYVPSGCPGGRAPHLWLAGHVSLFDAFGRGFSLLRFAKRAAADPLVEAAARRGVPLTVIELDHPEGRDLYGADLALVRPDHYVAWRGDRVPADPAGLLANVTGWTT